MNARVKRRQVRSGLCYDDRHPRLHAKCPIRFTRPHGMYGSEECECPCPCHTTGLPQTAQAVPSKPGETK